MSTINKKSLMFNLNDLFNVLQTKGNTRLEYLTNGNQAFICLMLSEIFRHPASPSKAPAGSLENSSQFEKSLAVLLYLLSCQLVYHS